MHEDFTREEKVQGSSDRSFGLVMAGFFAIVALLPLRHAPLSSIRWWALAVAAVFLVLALLWSAPLRPGQPALAEARVAALQGRQSGRHVRALLGGIVPIGLLMRLFGKDPLNLRFDPAATSYWIPREPPGPAPESMKNQFWPSDGEVRSMMAISARFWLFLRVRKKYWLLPIAHHDADLRRADRAGAGLRGRSVHLHAF